MYCCSNCFGDRGLEELIIPTISKQKGKCSFCGTNDIELVSPSALRVHFEQLLEIYDEDDCGKPLVEWLMCDWGMFNQHIIDLPNTSYLLQNIFNNEEIASKKFSPSKICSSENLNLWNKFKIEIKTKNRYFPKNKLDDTLLTDLLVGLETKPIKISKIWYRSRIQLDGTPFQSNEMGSPPPEKAQQGRANPSGIPYLYLASNTETAISEIRPHTGNIVCVAEVSIDDSLLVVDLRDPRTTISPFNINDDKNIANLRGDIEFLVDLGEELKRPVLPHAASIDYLPSQYLCEFIKQANYDGVLYQSSVGHGVNLALFTPYKGIIGKVKQYWVSKVTVELDKKI